MKNLISTFLVLLLFCGLYSQEIPQKISYHGKLLENGQLVTGTKSITFVIGTWSETHSNVQVSDGLYSVTLGETIPIPTSVFDNTSSVTLQITVSGTKLSPQTNILSVPYAYKAEKAVTAENIPTNVSELINDAGYITSPNDADADPSNELQTLSQSGINVTLSNGGGTISVADNDNSSSNELQSLSVIGNSLSISDGNSVILPSGGGENLSQTLAIGNSAGEYNINMNNKDIVNVNYLEMEGDLEFTDENYDILLRDGSDILFYNGANNLEGAIGANDATNLNGLDFFMTGGLFISDTWNRNDKYFSIVSGDLWTDGNISCNGTKSFTQDYPNDSTKEIVYVCLEGGEAGTYTRGTAKLTNGEAEINLPEHFGLVTTDSSLTAQITPRGNCNGIYIVSLNNTRLIVKELLNGKNNIEFDYFIQGIRKGYENHIVIRKREVK